MRESHCPELWGGPEEVYEASSIARTYLGAIGNANEVRVGIDAKLAVELVAGCDDERLEFIPGLLCGVDYSAEAGG